MSSNINPTQASMASQVSAAYQLSSRQSGRSTAAPTTSKAPSAGPAATVHLSALPSSVDSDDRATFMAMLKANQGDIGAALSALKAFDTGEKDG
jgi:hypothetical protein